MKMLMPLKTTWNTNPIWRNLILKSYVFIVANSAYGSEMICWHTSSKVCDLIKLKNCTYRCMFSTESGVNLDQLVVSKLWKIRAIDILQSQEQWHQGSIYLEREPGTWWSESRWEWETTYDIVLFILLLSVRYITHTKTTIAHKSRELPKTRIRYIKIHYYNVVIYRASPHDIYTASRCCA